MLISIPEPRFTGSGLLYLSIASTIPLAASSRIEIHGLVPLFPKRLSCPSTFLWPPRIFHNGWNHVRGFRTEIISGIVRVHGQQINAVEPILVVIGWSKLVASSLRARKGLLSPPDIHSTNPPL